MVGHGGVIKNHRHHQHWNDVVSRECRPNPSILCLNAALQWEPAHEPLHTNIVTKKVCGVGPGMSFSNAAQRRVNDALVGGTAIKEWERRELYENLVKRAKESEKHNEIKALLWYQGESDPWSEHDSEAYRANMEMLIYNVREDLILPSLLIIQVAIGSRSEYMEKVRETHKGIDIPKVICVNAKGLQLKEDNLHLTTEAQVQLGHMLAKAYLTRFGA